MNTFITVWHENGVGYSRKTFKNVFIRTEKILDKSGIKQMGMTNSSVLTVRIPQSEPICIDLGDYIIPEKSFDLSPERVRCFKVTQIYDNRHGSFPHYRIIANR